MAKSRKRSPEEFAEMQKTVLHTAAVMFLEMGYSKTTFRKIVARSGLDLNAVVRAYGSKENILCELVKYVLDGQFSAASKLIAEKTEDKILFYAAETTLQLYMAESDEKIREIYCAAYSLPNTTDYIQHTITGKLEDIFGEHLPDLSTKDFYELELASSGIMRSFMVAPCDMYFTMDRKVRRFLETSLRVYQLTEEKINEALEFVSQFDFATIAEEIVATMLENLKSEGC